MQYSTSKSSAWLVVAFAALMVFTTSGPRANAQVIPSDTFDISLVGANAANQAAYLVSPIDATFGTTQNFAGAGLGGQTVTITSSEVVGATTTTDTISISVPTNFDPTGTTIAGSPITQMQSNLGGSFAGTDTLDYQTPLNPTTTVFAGSATYSGGILPLTPGDTLTNGNMSLAMVEGLSSAGDLAPFTIHNFTFTVTYPNVAVPEPSSLALLGIVGLAPMARRWRKKTVVA